jgi:hypothetical protein
MRLNTNNGGLPFADGQFKANRYCSVFIPSAVSPSESATQGFFGSFLMLIVKQSSRIPGFDDQENGGLSTQGSTARLPGHLLNLDDHKFRGM